MKADAICTLAASLLSNERYQDYGLPIENHQNIADLWNAYLGTDLTLLQVAVMMCLLKIARTKAGLSIDNFVDLAGYAGIAGEIATEKDPATTSGEKY